MAGTFTVGGHVPFKWGVWREDHDPGDGKGARPGHVLYQAMPGDTIHEGWIKGLEGALGRLAHFGTLVAGAKVKDAPETPPDSMIRGFAEGTPQNAPAGHPLRDQAQAPAPDPTALIVTDITPPPVPGIDENGDDIAPAPVVAPAEPVPADPNDAASHVTDTPPAE